MRAFVPLLDAEEPLDVEIFTSGLLGTSQVGQFVADAADYAVNHPAPAGMALLCALSALGETEEIRSAASAGARELGRTGVASPSWAGDLGRVTVGACWSLADVYGDQATLYCEFAYGAKVHAVMALLDFNHLGGWVKDVWVTDRPHEVLSEMQAQSGSGLTVLEPKAPADCRRLLENGFAATGMIWRPEVAETFHEYRALALARCRALPEAASTVDDDSVVPESEPEAIVAEFLGSPQAAALTDVQASTRCARLIADFGADHDAGRITRVSPAKTEAFLHGWLPESVILTERERDAMPAVFQAWVRWAAGRHRLPEAASQELTEIAAECAGDFVAEYRDQRSAYLEGLELGDEAAARDALDRRRFAMPHVRTRIGDEDYPSLNPADPDERRILIEGEHPEWHELLDNPDFEGEIDGVNPRLHLTVHEVVANQLWDNDPPETWAAAKRLLGSGMQRHDVLHQLAGSVSNHIFRAVRGEQPADLASFLDDLDSLG
jgi:hypothetical protein